MENILFLAAFLSGAAALIYELLWFRLGGVVFGNSVWAASLVLASFMGGLALGNGLVTAAGHRLKAPIRWYAFFEVVIGITGLLLVCGFPSFTQIGAPLFRRLLDHPLLLNVLRTTTAFSLMVIPTSAMGATLPLLVKALNDRARRFGRALGLMYGWNTLGAFAGVILAETLLVRWFGLRGTGAIACGANLTAAALALIVARKSPDSDRASAEDGSRHGPGVSASPRVLLLAGAGFTTGFVFLALEVVWLRFLLLFFSAYALYFALILAAVLAGISCGGLLTAGWISRRGVASRWVGPLTLINAALIIALYAKFGWTFRLYSIMPIGGLAIMLYDCLFLIFPIAFLSGIIFTMLGRLLHDEIGVETAAVGLLTVANTSGGMLGALTAGFIGIPLLGVERSFLSLAIIYGLLGAALVMTRKKTIAPRFGFVDKAAIAIFLAAAALFPSGLMKDYLQFAPGILAKGTTRVAFREGVNETLQYFRGDLLGEPLYYRLITNGHSMSATDFFSRQYMKMFVYLPVAVNPRPKTALLICYGTGMTAQALAATRSLERIDIVDISRDVLELSHAIFPDPREDPLKDPRVRTHVEDGRFFLSTTPQLFDLITAEPPPPLFRGVVNLYTQEYFQLLSERLAPGGVVTHWLPVNQVPLAGAKAIARGFCNVFANCTLWAGTRTDWILMGIKPPARPVDAQDFRRQWEDPAVAPDLQALGFPNPEQFGSHFLADRRRLEAWSSGSPPLTDDFPYRLPNHAGDMTKDTIAYSQFILDADIAGDFARSPDLAQIWPEPLREKTAAYFVPTHMMLAARPSSPSDAVQFVHQLLSSPLDMRSNIDAIMGTDGHTQNVVDGILRRMNKSPLQAWAMLSALLIDRDPANEARRRDIMIISRQLAVQALCDKDYRLAEKYSALEQDAAAPSQDRLFFYLKIYLLTRVGDFQKAAALKDSFLRDIPTSQPRLRDETLNFWRWVTTSVRNAQRPLLPAQGA